MRQRPGVYFQSQSLFSAPLLQALLTRGEERPGAQDGSFPLGSRHKNPFISLAHCHANAGRPPRVSHNIEEPWDQLIKCLQV